MTAKCFPLTAFLFAIVFFNSCQKSSSNSNSGSGGSGGTSTLTSWVELGTGANALDANFPIVTMTIDAQNNIYVAGLLINSNGNLYVAKWNGTTWIQLGGINAPSNPFNIIYSI